MTAAAPGRVRAGPQHGHRRDALALACVAVVPVVASLVLTAVAGSLRVARTDDWSFARVAFALHRSGHLQLTGWAQMTLVGLVAWAQPWLWVFGDHQWVLALSAAVLMVGGLAAAYRVARRLLGPGASAVAVGAVVVFPGFLRDATTFMTDGPGFAVGAIVLAAGVAAQEARGRRRAMFTAAVVIAGFWGFTIREFAVAAPLAVLGAMAIADRSQRRRLAVLSAGFVTACAGFYLWRRGLPGAQALNSRPAGFTAATGIVEAAFTAALGLVPALAWSAGRWWHPRDARARLRGSAVGAVLVLVPMAYGRSSGHPVGWLVGDYLDRRGINGAKDLLGLRPVLLGGPLPALLNLAAIVAAIVVCGLLAEWFATRRVRTAPPTFPALVISLYVVAVAASLVVAAVVNGQLFDRYLWPAVLGGSILVLRDRPGWQDTSMEATAGRRRARRGAAVCVCAAFAAVSLALVANSDAFDAARWRAGDRLVAEGLAPGTVDAGFEWVGAHATALAHPSLDESVRGGRSWWSRWYPMPLICGEVSATPLAGPGNVPQGFALERVDHWNLLLVGVPESLYSYVSMDPRCTR